MVIILLQLVRTIIFVYLEIIKTILSKLKPSSSLFWYVFLLCIIPRIILAIVNKEANDDHITPIMLWQETGEFPDALDCWECYHPPFFYWVVKSIAKVFNADNWHGFYTTMGVVNFFFSAGVLWFILRVIESLKLRKWLGVSLMLFWGMNPELISIGALSTNDTPMLFFGFVITYLLIKHWRLPKLKYELPLVLLLAVLGVTKGNALFFTLAFSVLVALEFLKGEKWNFNLLVRQSFLIAGLIIFIGYFGNYYEKYEKYGYAFTTNQHVQNLPHFFNEDVPFEARKGVTSISSSFFRLQFLSLIETPYNVNYGDSYPEHRTSFWGQMFGQFSNYTFERHPLSWVSLENDNYNFTRINYILHLPLFILMLVAIFFGLKRQISSPLNQEIVHLLLVVLFTLLIVRYNYIYRDFSNMKVVFIYPVLYSIITLFSNQLQRLNKDKFLIFLLLSSTFIYQINFIYLLKSLIP